MGEIKSAFEIAMEKASKIGDATEEERLQWKYTPIGEKMAAQFLKGECDLSEELAKYEGKGVAYIKKAASDIILRNITLPVSAVAKRNTEKALEGLQALKEDKEALESQIDALQRIFSHYEENGEQQMKQAYENLKGQMEMQMRQALQQQMGTSAANVNIDIEKQPQFQEQWMALKSQLEAQYMTYLDDYKKELAALE